MRHDLIPFKDSTPVALFSVAILLHGSVGGGRKLLQVEVGATLRDMIPPGIDDECIRIGIDGHEIYAHHWGHVKPKAGAKVQILIHPGDPISIISVLASAAGSYVATYGIAGLVAAGSFGAAVAGAVISFAILALGQALFGQPERSRPTEETTFSINGARNRLAPYEPIPVVLGTHRFVPPLGANSFTEVAGNSQYLRMLVVWGYATVSLSEVRIGNTAIEDFVEVERQDDLTGLNTTFTLFPGTVQQENLAILLADVSTSNVFSQRDTDLDIDEFGITITLPSGLFHVDKKGRYSAATQLITGDYRIAGSADAWINFINPAVAYAGPTTNGGLLSRNKTSAQRYSWRVSGLASNQYEIRVKAATLTNKTLTTTIRDTSWTALRSFKNETPLSDTGIAATALRIKATDQLNGVVDQFNAVVSTLIPTWNGSIWTGSSASSNPAAIFRYILTGAPNAKAVAASKVNDAVLGEWYDYCVAEGFTYDRVIDYRTNIRDLLTEVAAAGTASPELLDGKWSVLIDRSKNTVVQHFTARNSWDFSSQILFVEVPHALRIRFNNSQAGYEEDERVVYDDGFNAGNATLFQTLDIAGVVEPDNVYKIGRRRLAEMRLRPEVFTFTVDMENLVATRGDRIYFSHDVPLIGQTSGRIKLISGTAVTLDEPVVMTTGTTYGLRVRASNGTSYLKTVTPTLSGTFSTVIVNNTTGIAVGDLFSFGVSGEETLDLLIKSIEGMDDLNAQITAIPYNEAIYSSADSIPAYTSIISAPVSPSFNGPPNPVIEKLQSDEAALTRTSAGDIEPGILVFVKGGKQSVRNSRLRATTYFQARFRSSDPSAQFDPYVYTPLIEADGAGGGILLTPVELNETYSVGVRAVGPAGETSGWATQNHTVVGNAAAPPIVDEFTMNVIGDHAYLEWVYVNPPTDHIGFEIRYATNQNVTNWNTMIVIAPQITRKDRSFTVPARFGSYAIKTFDYFGTYSTTAKYINASLEDGPSMNNLSSTVQHPAFSGTKTGLVVDSQNTMTIDLGSVLEGTYEFGETDLGAVISARHSYVASVTSENTLSTMSTWTTLASVENLSGTDTASDGTSVRMEIAYSLDDVGAGQVYTDWRPFIVGDYTARWVKYRLVLTTDNANITPVVLELSTSIDAFNTVQSGANVVSGTSTNNIVFSPAFFALKTLSIAPQNMASGDYYVISSKSATGFSIIFRNSAGAGVNRTYDWTAIGYGTERGT